MKTRRKLDGAGGILETRSSPPCFMVSLKHNHFRTVSKSNLQWRPGKFPWKVRDDAPAPQFASFSTKPNFPFPDRVIIKPVTVHHICDCGIPDYGTHYHEIRLASDQSPPFQSRHSIQAHYFPYLKEHGPTKGHWAPNGSKPGINAKAPNGYPINVNCGPGECMNTMVIQGQLRPGRVYEHDGGYTGSTAARESV